MRYKLIEDREFVLPTHWASWLINGDASGLDDEEQMDIDTWLDEENEKLPPGQHIECTGVADDSDFWLSNDAGTLPDECSTFTFLLYEEDPE